MSETRPFFSKDDPKKHLGSCIPWPYVFFAWDESLIVDFLSYFTCCQHLKETCFVGDDDKKHRKQIKYSYILKLIWDSIIHMMIGMLRVVIIYALFNASDVKSIDFALITCSLEFVIFSIWNHPQYTFNISANVIQAFISLFMQPDCVYRLRYAENNDKNTTQYDIDIKTKFMVWIVHIMRAASLLIGSIIGGFLEKYLLNNTVKDRFVPTTRNVINPDGSISEGSLLSDGEVFILALICYFIISWLWHAISYPYQSKAEPLECAQINGLRNMTQVQTFCIGYCVITFWLFNSFHAWPNAAIMLGPMIAVGNYRYIGSLIGAEFTAWFINIIMWRWKLRKHVKDIGIKMVSHKEDDNTKAKPARLSSFTRTNNTNSVSVQP